MSLILDALKKSEQERRRDKGPDLQTIHQPIVTRVPQRSYGMVWGVLLVAVNMAAIGYWWQQRGVPANAAATTSNINSSTVPASAVLPAAANASTPAVTPAVAANATVNAAATAAAMAAPLPPPAAQPLQAEYASITPGGNGPGSSAAANADGRIEEVDELPEDVRNNLPAMTFSFHVFSSNPQQRTIIINNRRMREGDEINAGMLLQQITEDGVILLYAQHRIHISVLSGW